jgi:hypothetical protein
MKNLCLSNTVEIVFREHTSPTTERNRVGVEIAPILYPPWLQSNVEHPRIHPVCAGTLKKRRD